VVGVQAATYALYLGDEAVAKKVIKQQDRASPRRSSPTAASRWSWSAPRRSTTPVQHPRARGPGDARPARGLDTWNYQTDDGRSLRKAIDWMLPFIDRRAKWDTSRSDAEDEGSRHGPAPRGQRVQRPKYERHREDERRRLT
jgi:hypothetical protein